jgi:predicted lipoprotein with Yx(FWY)xxD motif
MRLTRPIAVLAAALVLSAPPTALAEPGSPARAGTAQKAHVAAALVRKLRTSEFGTVLATPARQALYYWTPERRNPGEIRCTGACARAWPPLYVKRGVVVPRKMPGFRGTFGTIVRPNGRRQLTYNRLPLYTYAHEGPGQVLCNDVDGWFVVRV